MSSPENSQTPIMFKPKPDLGGDLSPFRQFNREEWSRLRADTPLTLDEYCARPHVLVSHTANVSGFADEWLAEIGRTRQVVLSVPQYSALPALLVGTDLIASLPDYTAAAMAASGQLFKEPFPFKNVPREWNAVVEKYGAELANRNGRLPWRAEEVFNQMVDMFTSMSRPTPSYAGDNVRYLAAILAHYVEDAHMPFHAVEAYDGQPNQRGIHTRTRESNLSTSRGLAM